MSRHATVWVLPLLALACGTDGVGASDTDAADSSSGVASSGVNTLPVTTASSQTQGTSTTPSTSDTGTTGPTSDTDKRSSTGEADSSTGGAVETACDVFDDYAESLAAAADSDERIVLTDAFISAGQYSDTGFPLRCEGRTIFFAVDISSAEPSTTVAGAFNDWDPTADLMLPIYEGFGAFALELDLDTDAGAYKMVSTGDTFTADPLARRFGWDEFGEFSLVDAPADAGHHERWPRFAEGVGDLEPRTLTVFVPQVLNANPASEVGVLYLHDGQNVFSPDAFFGGWRASGTLAALLESQAVAPVLMVGIDNTPARLDEYSHVTDEVGGGTVGGRADEYADFLVTGIKPFIDTRYSTQTGPEFTGVLGSSMGGLVSLVLGQRHPEVFGYAGSMSGTLGWGTIGSDNETIAQRYADAPPNGLTLYIDSGGDGPCPGGGSDNYCENVGFVDVVRAAGWTDEADLYYRWEPGAGHNEAAWAGRLEGALVDWFPGPLPRDGR